jgi:integrase
VCATLEEGEAIHALYATAVYTGLRFGELAGLRWDAIDFERRLITVAGSYDGGLGSTKGGETRFAPIVDALLPALRASACRPVRRSPSPARAVRC